MGLISIEDENIYSQNLYFRDMNYVIVDVETTGGSTNASKIIEIALFKHNGVEVIDSYSTLINPETPIPFFISKLTGITDSMVKDAPRFEEVSQQIMDFSAGCVFVAHNVSFDYNMLRHEFRLMNIDYRLPHLCTVRASRYVLPGHESYSLGKLTRSLGIELNGRHRAAGDAASTAELFTLLLQTDSKQLQQFIQAEVDTSKIHPTFNLFSLDEIPNRPGIFMFYDENDELCYVSKAKELKKQIERCLRSDEKIPIGEFARVSYELCGSELIAGILEQQCIAQQQPRYNKLRRSNKYAISVLQSASEEMRLTIDKSQQTRGRILQEFSTKKEALLVMTSFMEQHELNLEDSFIHPQAVAQFLTTDKQTTLKLNASENRLATCISNWLSEKESYFIVDKGRTKFERSIVWVEHEHIVSYGYLPHYIVKQNQHQWLKYLTEQVLLANSSLLLSSYHKKPRGSKIPA